MGQRGGPNIPLDNIYSYTDSLNKNSYSGTGNTVLCLFNNFNYSYINSATITAILKNIALVLNGSTQYGASGNNIGSLASNASKTLCCWVYLNSTANQSIVSFGNNSSGNTCFELALTGGNFIFRTGPGYTYTLSAAAISTWYHFAITYNTTFVIFGNYSFYVNGVLYSTVVGGPNAAVNTTISIGNPIDPANFGKLNGSVNQLMTYTARLSATEIAQIYNAQKSRYGL
jgi:hypothetical protein